MSLPFSDSASHERFAPSGARRLTRERRAVREPQRLARHASSRERRHELAALRRLAAPIASPARPLRVNPGAAHALLPRHERTRLPAK